VPLPASVSPTEALAPPAHPDIDFAPIARIQAPDLERFRRDYERPGRPVIIAGLVDRWRLTRQWSLDRFAHTYKGSRVVCVKSRPDGHLADSETGPVCFERIAVPEFVRALRTDPTTPNYMSAPLANFPPSFHEEFSKPPYCVDALSCRPQVWVGRAGTLSPLHFDVAENLFAQVHGRKRFVIYPPAQRRYLYPYPPWSRMAVLSRVNPEAPDLQRFPLFAKTRPVGCILHAGELLFLPSGWWHQVRALDESVSMSFWYGGLKVVAYNCAVSLFRRLRGMEKGEWDID
jgi:hypothetical protein